MRPTRRRLLAALAALPLSPRLARAEGSGEHAPAPAPARVAEVFFAADPLTGLALRGFDPITYFLDGVPRPRPGRPGIELGHGGVVWRFEGAANREAFRTDPAVYAPKLGGYDAVGAARGRLVDADPLLAALVAGRLYLFRAPEGRERALAEPGLLAEAEMRWPSLRP